MIFFVKLLRKDILPRDWGRKEPDPEKKKSSKQVVIMNITT